MKQLKKHQAALKELTRDAEEAHQGKAEAIQQYKELEKKVKSLEAELIQLQEDLSAADSEVKELNETSNNVYVKQLREKFASQNIEIASLKVELRKSGTCSPCPAYTM